MYGTIPVVPHANYLFVVGEDGNVYFLHFSHIKKGEKLIAPGQSVTFDVAPPLPGGKHPLAINAVVGDTSNNGGAR